MDGDPRAWHRRQRSGAAFGALVPSARPRCCWRRVAWRQCRSGSLRSGAAAGVWRAALRASSAGFVRDDRAWHDRRQRWALGWGLQCSKRGARAKHYTENKIPGGVEVAGRCADRGWGAHGLAPFRPALAQGLLVGRLFGVLCVEAEEQGRAWCTAARPPTRAGTCPAADPLLSCCSFLGRPTQMLRFVLVPTPVMFDSTC